MENILEVINSNASYYTEADLDPLSKDLAKHYQPRIDSLAFRVYGPQPIATEVPVALKAFRETARLEIRSALNTFLIKFQHWKFGRDINRYLLKCLSRLADKTYWEATSVKKQNLPLCPACRESGRKEVLFFEYSAKLWRCFYCTESLEFLNTEIAEAVKDNDTALASVLECKKGLCKAFSLHSRKGWRCPDCLKFIPASLETPAGIACPYLRCAYFGPVSTLEAMAHPVTQTAVINASLNAPIKNEKFSSEQSVQDLFEAENIQADVKIDFEQRIQKEYEILLQVIEDQMDSLKRMNNLGTLQQKLLMYTAYRQMIDRFPDEMVSYLVHEKKGIDSPIQSRIFQQYADLVADSLPLTIFKKDEPIDIVDLTDPELALFDGISVFSSEIEPGFIIPNKTIETYTGGRKGHNYGSCFLGKLIDVVDRNDKSILHHVKDYTFAKINMRECVSVGEKVKVTHFRLLPHYEMDSLVFLQRIRRQIVDKVHLRLNKKKREPKRFVKDINLI